jgi:hypothetical protein
VQHEFRREQRLFLRLVIALGVVGFLTVAPLAASASLRLSVGQRLGLAPGADAERLYGPDDEVELVVLIREVPTAISLPIRRYTAVYVADRGGETVRLRDLTRGGEIALPLRDYDLIAGAADQSALLFVDRSEPSRPEAALVTVATGDVRALPPGTTDPGIPGDWSTDLPFAHIGCSGSSPGGGWVACVQRGGTRYFFGDWELEVHRAGHPERRTGLLRELGLDPVVGWAADESAVYVQGERGLWRLPMP